MLETTAFGNAVGTPRIHEDRNGNKFMTLRIGCNTKMNGEDHTNWVDVTCWGDKTIEYAMDRVRKGTPLAAIGELSLEPWTDKDGYERWALKLRSRRLKVYGPKAEDGGGYGGTPRRRKAADKPAEKTES